MNSHEPYHGIKAHPVQACGQCGQVLIWMTCVACGGWGTQPRGLEIERSTNLPVLDKRACLECAGNGGYWTHVRDGRREEGAG